MHSAAISAVGWNPRRWGTDVHAWLRADAGNIVIASGGVERWIDRGRGARDFTQATPANRLGWSASDAAFGGRPVVLGTGSGWLDGPGSWSQAFAVFGVVAIGSLANWRTIFDHSAGARAAVRAELSNLLATYAGTINVTSVSVAGPSSFAAIFNGSSSAHYVNSVTAGGLSSPGPDGVGTPRIGAGPGGVYPLHSTSKVAEIVILKRTPSAADIARWFRYTRGWYRLPVTGL